MIARGATAAARDAMEENGSDEHRPSRDEAVDIVIARSTGYNALCVTP